MCGNHLIFCALLLSQLSRNVDAFIVSLRNTLSNPTCCNVHLPTRMSINMLPSFIPEDQALDGVTSSSINIDLSTFNLADLDLSIVQQFGDSFRTFAIVISSLLFLFAGISILIANDIVPKAAAQLEKETKELRPDLWEEYSAKLDDGDTFASRPDLLSELGTIMQPIILANAERKLKLNFDGKVEDAEVPTSEKKEVKDMELDDFLAGLTIFTANNIVPQVAEELEKKTKALRPDLLEEYSSKLEDGETFATRTDLFQELDKIMEPIILADEERVANLNRNAKDAEILKEKESAEDE